MAFGTTAEVIPEAIRRCHEAASSALDRGLSRGTPPCTCERAGLPLRCAACPRRGPNAIPFRGAGAGANADAKGRAARPHLRRGERGDIAAARHGRGERHRGAERAGRGGTRGCGCDPAAAIFAPYAGTVGAAVTAPPDRAEARRAAIPAPLSESRFGCVDACAHSVRPCVALMPQLFACRESTRM